MDALTFLTLPPRSSVKVERTMGMPAYYHAECLPGMFGWKAWLEDMAVVPAPAGFVCLLCGCKLEDVKWMY